MDEYQRGAKIALATHTDMMERGDFKGVVIAFEDTVRNLTIAKEKCKQLQVKYDAGLVEVLKNSDLAVAILLNQSRQVALAQEAVNDPITKTNDDTPNLFNRMTKYLNTRTMAITALGIGATGIATVAAPAALVAGVAATGGWVGASGTVLHGIVLSNSVLATIGGGSLAAGGTGIAGGIAFIQSTTLAIGSVFTGVGAFASTQESDDKNKEKEKKV
jgi:hypothetical protein